MKPLTKTVVSRGGGIAARFAQPAKGGDTPGTPAQPSIPRHDKPPAVSAKPAAGAKPRVANHHVYGLFDPATKSVFYVGCSTSVPSRLTDHANDRASAAWPRCQAITERGDEVEYRIFASPLPKHEAETLERQLIRSLPDLVNKALHRDPDRQWPHGKPRYARWRDKNPELYKERQAGYMRKRRKADKDAKK